jgi:hypothetical protein
MPAGKKPQNGGAQNQQHCGQKVEKEKEKDFHTLCNYVKDKCEELKTNNCDVSDTLEELGDRLISDGGKLQKDAPEKTAIHVLTLLMPILDAIITEKNDAITKDHEAKISKLQVGLRKSEYSQDALEQYT